MPQSIADELSSIPMSPGLGESLERAHRFAREQSHKAVTLEHLLLALTEDGEAALILQSANIDLARLGTDVSGYLGRLLEDMRSDGTSEPRPDGDLLRVLQAAASAAKQSRRRQIDGAIVLAAIVGDGKSPAAGLLKALGMTFEEAIRALQRANAQARLKPTVKRVASAAPAPRAAAEPATPEPAPPAPEAAPEALAAAEPSASAPAGTAGVSQSAEEILAAARARIQQRAAGAGKAEPAPANERRRADVVGKLAAASEGDSEAPQEPVQAADTASLTEAIEAAMTGTARVTAPAPPRHAVQQEAAPAPPAAAAPPPAPAVGQPVRQAWTPLPEPRPAPANRLPQPPPPARVQPPFPARPVAPGEGPRRPPLPPPAPPVSQLPAGFPNRPPRAPWPEPGEHAPAPRPGLANGAYNEAPPGPPIAPSAKAQQQQRAGGHPEKGLLIESVPRRVRLGVPAGAEVRIARERIDALIATLSSRGSVPLPEQPLMRALSVRLRSPGGDFWIEPATPETQWMESGSSLIHDDYAIWRWTVVARRRGRGRLTLMVSARTLGRDGVAAESAPPDRVIEVRIGGNPGRTLGRWTGWIVAMLAGAAVGYFSDQIWALAGMVLRRVISD